MTADFEGGLASSDGGLLVSDHPAWAPVPFADDAVTVGRVVWTARALV